MNLLTPQINSFLAIINAGSITGAAEMLGVAKSGVSEHLRQLEDRLDVQLIVRTTRRQRLTPIGVQFLERCRELRHLSDVALEEISNHLAEPMGIFRVTAPHALIGSIVAPAIAKLVKQYPKVIPELVISDERLDLVDDRIDLSITVTVGTLADSEYMAQRIGSFDDVLCVSKSFIEEHKLNQRDLGDIPKISTWPYIAHKWEGHSITHICQSANTEQSHAVSFKPALIANNLEATKALTSEGAGIAMLPEYYIRSELEQGDLVRVLSAFEPRKVNVHAIHPFGKRAPLSVKTITKLIKQTIVNR